jgi:aminomethyltransferase
MTSTTELKRSPLHDWHARAGAKLIDFYGWELPVQYTSIMDEHHAVRQAAGLFDISHMGQIMIEGDDAFAFIQSLITGDLNRVTVKGLGTYGHLCLPTGGVIDDVFVYGLKDAKRYLMIVNGATHEKDVAWLMKHATPRVTITDLSQRAGFAIQGSKALSIIKEVIAGIAELPRFAYQQIQAGAPNETLWGCRTGYTGEDGAEFFGPARTIVALWKQMMEAGTALGLKPCGLGARDTLRLEAGYPLYGHELNEDRTSLEANLEWAVKWSKGDFIGRAALERQKQEGVKDLLLAYELLERGVPRQGAKVIKNGEPWGITTSGTFSPSLQKGIGLAYAPGSWNIIGSHLEVELHGKRVKAKVVSLPFYKKQKGIPQ